VWLLAVFALVWGLSAENLDAFTPTGRPG